MVRSRCKSVREQFREKLVRVRKAQSKLPGGVCGGKDAMEAVHNAVVLEEVAMMAWHTEALPENQTRENLPEYVKEKHFMRKHGPNAYYGQKK